MKKLLFEIENRNFPRTRYQGSKLKISNWIWENIKDFRFNSVLDAFGGSAAVAYLLKTKGKQVIYNDALKFNYFVGLALIKNKEVRLSEADIESITRRHKGIKYPTFITDTFKEIYYTQEENKWLDMAVTNINRIDNKLKKAMAFFVLFQSCIIKRPFNLFHRKNLYMRIADVKRSFGNKTTWDKPFDFYFRKFSGEINNAIFDNQKKNQIFCKDVFDLNVKPDLVYIDTPYISSQGTGVDYFDFYHFLEGMTNYQGWGKEIDWDTKNRRLKKVSSIWIDKTKIKEGFDRLFRKFKDSILVVSYRSDGIPSVDELVSLLKKYKSKVHEANHIRYKYVFSKSESKEMLLLAE